MSRFIDRTATVRYTMPDGCQCPDTPHETDWIDFRSQLGISDILAAGLESGDPLAGLERVIVDWNLQLPNGQVAPITRESVGDLFGENFEGIGTWIGEHITARPMLPNHSGAHSRNGSRASASRGRGRPR